MYIKNQYPHQKNLRKGRYSSDNQIYHITTTTLSRVPVFKDFYAARMLVNILKTSDELNNTSTLAFVVMPDHIHWLFQLNQKQSLSKLIQGIKSISSRAYGKPIWQTGYYDHAIRKDEDIVNIARYIIANPIRAGLVKRVGDYPHWHAVWL
jgi:putative transposase